MNIWFIFLYFFEPITFRLYLFYRSVLIPLWYYFLYIFVPNKTDYFLVIMKHNICSQYVLTPETYQDISSTPFLPDYFLLVSHVSYMPQGVYKRCRVVDNSRFKILPMQSWTQSKHQVNLIEEMYDIDISTPIEKILLGGQCACKHRKLTFDLDPFCIAGNILFTRSFNIWLWTIFLKEPPLTAQTNLDITIIDTDINEITLDQDEYIEISCESYKRLRKTI